jgi:glycerol-3-phosphate dehydrogenase
LYGAVLERSRQVKRDLAALTEQEFDLVIVGGGIFGACAAWDAAQRGLSVALVERGDFCHATSANHFKMVHGGIRYLQHADVLRIRESSNERRALLRTAPHLVQPLPIVLPTYGHGWQGKELLAAGFWLYDALVWDRNRGLRDPQRRIPHERFLSRAECLRLFPALEPHGLTGAVLFYDGQMYNPPRLVLAYLRSAVSAGAQVANYLEATRFLHNGERVFGVVGHDLLSGAPVDIRGKVVLNAAGPWAERLLEAAGDLRLTQTLTFSRDACFVVARPLLGGPYALAVPGRTRDPDALVSRSHRHLFVVPWREATLIGVWHVVHHGAPDAFTVTEDELVAFLDELNAAYPGFALTLEDVALWNAGLVLFGHNRPGATDLRYGKRSCLIDHTRTHQLHGLVTLVGVRATTARGLAVKAIDLVCRKLDRQVSASRTAVTPVYGGRIETFEPFLSQAIQHRPLSVHPASMRALVHNYGTEYTRVLQYLDEDSAWAETLGSSAVLQAEVVHAVREEMAQKLSDVVLRRTELGTTGHPGDEALWSCVALMAAELGWNRQRVDQEVAEVCRIYGVRSLAGRKGE